jgi:hypothetical protein
LQARAAPPDGDERRQLPRVALVLRRDGDRVALPHGQVTQAQPVQGVGEPALLQQPAIAGGEERQRRAHPVAVELDAGRVGVGHVAAVCHDQRPSIAQHGHLVRPDPVARELSHAPVPPGGVIAAHDAATFLPGLLGGEEERAVARVDAVPAEEPVTGVLDRGQDADASRFQSALFLYPTVTPTWFAS